MSTDQRGDVKVRSAGPDDWDAIRLIDEQSFGFTWEDGREERIRADLELDRTIIADLDSEPVGLASVYSLDLSLPGGTELPAAGVTWVGVLPTHRRRGVLTAMMRFQLGQVRDRGEALAVLYASEPQIYGRFGYGSATSAVSLTVDRARSELRGPDHGHLRPRLVAAAQARVGVDAVYEAVRRERPGMPRRSDAMWHHATDDPAGEREGWSERRLVLVEGEHGPRGYAMYRTRNDWSQGIANGQLRVQEALSLDAAAAAALWHYLSGVDLMTSVTAWNVPVDDPLLLQLADPRWARPVLHDGMHVRLVDLPRALAARTYDARFDGVVEVVDGFLPENAGRWHLDLGDHGARCTRTQAGPDLTMSVRDLGAVYLGGGSVLALAAAGLVTEHAPGAAAAAARAFRHDPAPYCPFVF